MALATLCTDLSDEINGSYDDTEVFTAFIVDHQLRQGSSEEALEVQEHLYKLGIPSEVLQIQWPGDTDAKSLTNLETLARRLRFRLLGQACRDHGIESLLLAHHSDDQAETVLMRLIEGHRGMGLRGMRPAGDIPECFGMHGVHQSHAEWIDSGVSSSPIKRQRAVDVEYWGIQVLRPLLPFSKARLTATCEASGTQWVEDETNKDPTLTMRNTIRYLYNTYRLPAALSKPALLQMTQRTADKIRQREKEVNSLLDQLDAVLDLRSGELAIRFPRNFYPPSQMGGVRLYTQSVGDADDTIFFQPNVKQFDVAEGKIVAAMLIRRLVNLVTPRENVDLSSLETAVRHLFPRLYILSPLDDIPDRVPTSFTAAGVLFERVQTPDDYFPYYTWMLSRQPYHRDEQPTITIPPTGSSIDSTPTTSRAAPTNFTANLQAFNLFDGRWWLRIDNPSPTTPLTVRPFRQTDLKPVRACLSGIMRERFEALRIDAAKNKARFTLPVITAPCADGGDEVVAVPTFGVKVNEEGG
ncbi:tRNA(Ile)-lysidine/2-thiocytidine synthase [Macrophomina phaseolina MS6]|uniref:tRNA(Ile)-lysidine synthetase n=1 Tax=Macrophomina phaseolina (strain MS6) TaxID=1126212 RepID=K2SR60_MACPH|nr:tRNA(Ile)-lysidine/2-thiocytidine synthase [Macrophomina phaseolina MS6]